MSAGVLEVDITLGHEGRRLDKYLRAHLKGVPASVLFKQMRKGDIKVNGKKADPSYRVRKGDRIRIWQVELPADLPPPSLISRSLKKLIKESIVFEDDELIVVNKPADIPVHVGTGHSAGIIEIMRQLYPDHKDLELVHRLDRETSGLLMISKSPKILRFLQEILRDNEEAIPRKYLLLVEGSWPKHVRRVDMPLKRTATSVIPHASGQRALTHFDVLTRFKNATLMKAQLSTGRKHQIRVHAQHVGNPIIGDSKYGRMRDKHLFLHAAELEVPMPDGRVLHFDAPEPDYWKYRERL